MGQLLSRREQQKGVFEKCFTDELKFKQTETVVKEQTETVAEKPKICCPTAKTVHYLKEEISSKREECFRSSMIKLTSDIFSNMKYIVKVKAYNRLRYHVDIYDDAEFRNKIDGYDRYIDEDKVKKYKRHWKQAVINDEMISEFERNGWYVKIYEVVSTGTRLAYDHYSDHCIYLYEKDTGSKEIIMKIDIYLYSELGKFKEDYILEGTLLYRTKEKVNKGRKRTRNILRN